MRNAAILILCLLLLSSCFKEEDKREAFTNYRTLEIGNDYLNQIFYSLGDTSIVSTNQYTDWNLAFYCGNDASFVRLNAAANMWVFKTNSTNFGDNFEITYSESDKRFDGSHGLRDNLAIDSYLESSAADSAWCTETVYLIHPGIDAKGVELGSYKQFVFVGLFEDSYFFKIAELDGSNAREYSLPKDPSKNYVCFSWNSFSPIEIEPDKNTWDLLFSRFTDTVYTTDGSEFLTGYAVTGAYLNQNSVEAYMQEEIGYPDFQLGDVDPNKFSSRLNVIGHDWKQFSDQYNIYKNKVYIIKDRNGIIYKLRFLDFYDATTGFKGYPSFEYEAL